MPQIYDMGPTALLPLPFTPLISSLQSSLHLHPGLQICLFPSGLPTKSLYVPLLSLIHATCPAHIILGLIIPIIFGTAKGKVHPITGHEGPEEEKMYSSTLSITSALDGGGWSTPRPGRFTPGKDTVPIV